MMAAPTDLTDPEIDMDGDSGAEDMNRLINEEYKTWKKNCQFMYDMVLSTALNWPTLTAQWLPDVKEVQDKNYRIHRLLLGTNTSGHGDNYLQFANVEIPKQDEPRPEDYDEDRGEIGGHGHKSAGGESPVIKFKISQKIDHPGEVNKARYQPKNADIIATLAVDGKVLIFDRTKHSSEATGIPNPQLELVGHSQEGFGLDWNPNEEGALASGSYDATVNLWDLKNMTANSKTLKPIRTYTHHTKSVNDVAYHPVIKPWIGTVSDDQTLQILDIRAPDTHRATMVAMSGGDAHSNAINALEWCPSVDHIIATASSDRTVALWDLRSLKDKVHSLAAHVDEVTHLSWHPNEPSILASGSYDRRVLIWDLSKIGEEQLPEDSEDGPPELLFMHAGHTNHLTDLCWNPNEPWVVCSTSEDNLLQVWRIAEAITKPDDSSLPMDELERERDQV